MKLNKIAVSISLTTILSTMVFSATNHYIGLKGGTLNTSKSIYGYKDDSDLNPALIKYDDAKLIGVEYQLLTNIENNFIMWGIGTEVMFNDGNFLEGGMVALDCKLGTYYKDFNFYGLIGYGLQSLSDYTVATGMLYGIGVNYNMFKHMSLKIEYRNYDFKTTDNEDLTKNQTYTLSGVLAGISMKF